MRILLWLTAILIGFAAAPQCAWAVNNAFPTSGDTLMCSGRPWIDVVCNGADPAGSADSTSAINTTVAAAITGNFPVHFPAGTYKVTSKLTWDYAGVAGNGLKVISENAILNGQTIASGNVLQIICSGGSTGSPAQCHGLKIEGNLSVTAITPAYAVVIGKTDFSDEHLEAAIDGLNATNTSTVAGAAGIQVNYLVGADLRLQGKATGGFVGIAIEQMQRSILHASDAEATGVGAVSLLIEGGAANGNTFAALNFGAGPTCLSITSTSAQNNIFVAPYFACTTAVGFASGSNTVVSPTFAGTNVGPMAPGLTVIGRGAVARWTYPAASTYIAQGADDGAIISTANAPGSLLSITLPSPSAVGSGWSMGFATENGRGITVSPPGGAFVLAGGNILSSMSSGRGNYEFFQLQSDGTNYRLLTSTWSTSLAMGLLTSGMPSNWLFPATSGYAANLNDNGNVLSSALTSGAMTVTLPSAPLLPTGWSLAFAPDAGNSISLQVNGVSGGNILAGGATVSSYAVPTGPAPTAIQFDGANFRVIESGSPSLWLTHVPTQAILATLPGNIAPRVYRDGYYAAGDGGAAVYTWGASACVTASGAGDTGAESRPSDANGCFLADFDAVAPNILQWGAKADNSTNTSPFIQASHDAQIGRPIKIPGGHGVYLLGSHVEFNGLKQPAYFVGDGWAEYNQGAACPTGKPFGTWLHITSPSFQPFEWNDTGAIVGSGGRQAGDGGFYRTAVCQDHATPGPGWAPTAYPPVFRLSATINTAQVNFDDIYFYGIFAGINNYNFARFSIKNIRGQVFSYFLDADHEQDRSVMDDVWIWPYWSNNVNVMTWQQMHGAALILRYVDGLHAGKFGAFGYNACIQLENGALTFSAFHASFDTVLCDQTAFGVLNHSTNATVHFGSLVVEAATNYWTTPPDTECIKSTVGGATITADHFRCLGSWYGAIDMSGGGNLFIANGGIDNTDLILDPNVPMIKVGGGLVSIAANMNLYCPGSCSKVGGAVFQPITNWDRGLDHYDPGIFFYPGGYQTNERIFSGDSSQMQNFAPVSRLLLHGTATIASYSVHLPVITEEAFIHSDVAITALTIANPPTASWPLVGCPTTLAAGGTIRAKWHIPFPGAASAVWECY